MLVQYQITRGHNFAVTSPTSRLLTYTMIVLSDYSRLQLALLPHPLPDAGAERAVRLRSLQRERGGQDHHNRRYAQGPTRPRGQETCPEDYQGSQCP